MKSRHRVLSSLEHKKPDKIPFDLGSTKVTGITKNAYINLLNYLEIKVEPIKFFDVTHQLVKIKEDVLDQLEVDIRGLMPNLVRKNPHIGSSPEKVKQEVRKRIETLAPGGEKLLKK